MKNFFRHVTESASRYRVFWALTLGILSAVFCRYWVDRAVAQWCWMRYCKIDGYQYSEHSKYIREIIDTMEVFGNHIGIIIVVLLIHELDRQHRKRIFHFLTTVIAAGLTADVIKLFVIRQRPRGFSFLDPALVRQHDVLLIDWTPWTSTFESVKQSFPSGHTAVAFGAFVMLSFWYPKGRQIFLMMAILVGIQRIMVGAHFPSDVIVGAMIGMMVGRVCTWYSRPEGVSDRTD